MKFFIVERLAESELYTVVVMGTRCLKLLMSLKATLLKVNVRNVDRYMLI